MYKVIINKSKTKLFVNDLTSYLILVNLHVIKDRGFYYGTWFDIDELDNITDEFVIELYNGWDAQILKKLKEVVSLADCYSNPLMNDGGGTKLCYDILDSVRPLIKKLENSII